MTADRRYLERGTDELLHNVRAECPSCGDCSKLELRSVHEVEMRSVRLSLTCGAQKGGLVLCPDGAILSPQGEKFFQHKLKTSPFDFSVWQSSNTNPTPIVAHFDTTSVNIPTKSPDTPVTEADVW